jgi:hypothetical protein
VRSERVTRRLEAVVRRIKPLDLQAVGMRRDDLRVGWKAERADGARHVARDDEARGQAFWRAFV